MWRSELESPHSIYLAVEDEECIVAHVGVKGILDELHVMTLAVHPGYRRRGLARALVGASIAAAPETRVVHLEVRPGNAAARTLYESLGFRVTTRRPGYYGDEDALLMTLDLRARHR